MKGYIQGDNSVYFMAEDSTRHDEGCNELRYSSKEIEAQQLDV